MATIVNLDAIKIISENKVHPFFGWSLGDSEWERLYFAFATRIMKCVRNITPSVWSFVVMCFIFNCDIDTYASKYQDKLIVVYIKILGIVSYFPRQVLIYHTTTVVAFQQYLLL